MMTMAMTFGIPTAMQTGIAFGPTLVLIFAAIAALGFAVETRGLRKAAVRHIGSPTSRPASTVRPAHAV